MRPKDKILVKLDEIETLLDKHQYELSERDCERIQTKLDIAKGNAVVKRMVKKTLKKTIPKMPKYQIKEVEKNLENYTPEEGMELVKTIVNFFSEQRGVNIQAFDPHYIASEVQMRLDIALDKAIPYYKSLASIYALIADISNKVAQPKHTPYQTRVLTLKSESGLSLSDSILLDIKHFVEAHENYELLRPDRDGIIQEFIDKLLELAGSVSKYEQVAQDYLLVVEDGQEDLIEEHKKREQAALQNIRDKIGPLAGPSYHKLIQVGDDIKTGRPEDEVKQFIGSLTLNYDWPARNRYKIGAAIYKDMIGNVDHENDPQKKKLMQEAINQIRPFFTPGTIIVKADERASFGKYLAEAHENARFLSTRRG